MKKTIIGHITCPVCPHTDAEVKEDKNGHAYAHCPDCNAQVFTRNTHRDTNLRKKMRAVTVTVTEQPAPTAPTEQPVTVPAPIPTAKPKPAAVKPPAPAPKPTPPAPLKKTSSWFSPILAVGGGDE
jgi:hypothetical protein